ncbi:protein LEAD-SENSITIVE 1-like [Lolium rigidum]|uniref:protein LEAD-SENSITIVE 1-like n=1 Tax=Lolium rigidum TaxID=89674 RepID=UPI001F5DABCC|nr:protein LEAD-SENSITIVE 1-like [Lolium rigidum]
MGVLSNRVEKETLNAGDHIYSWRAAWVYTHHEFLTHAGIYVADDKVIHFTAGRGWIVVGAERVIDLLPGSYVPSRRTSPCLVCRSYQLEVTAVTNSMACSCLSCFMVEGRLYRFEYGVSKRFFFAKVRGGTCTLATADPDELVVHRASYLLRNGFRCYNLIKTNCEDFALYCKTGLIVTQPGSTMKKMIIGQSGSGQVVSYIAGTASIICGLGPTLYCVSADM